MRSRCMLPALLYAALLVLAQPQKLAAQAPRSQDAAGSAVSGFSAAGTSAGTGRGVTGQTNVLVDRVEILPLNFSLGAEIRLCVFFERTAGVLEYSRPPENFAVGMEPPDIISIELTSAADGLECLNLQLIAWNPGQNWLQIPEYQGLIFPPLSFQVQSVLDAAYQPDLLGQLEVRGFRYQLIALLAALALFLLLLLALAIFLPGFTLAAAGRRRARRAVRLLERQLRLLEKNAGSDAAAWQSFCRIIGEFLQERLACPDYLRWRNNPDPGSQGGQQSPSPGTGPRSEARQLPDLPFLPALAAVELEQLPADWLPSDVRQTLLQLMRKGEAVCWAGRPDAALPAAIKELRALAVLLESRLQAAIPSGPAPARSELSS